MDSAEKYYNFVKDFNLILENKKYKDLIAVCIGTDRITGDCFGPIVGSILLKKQQKYHIPNFIIIGNLENNMCFNEIQKNLVNRVNQYDNPLIISIDAALSNKNNIGEIFVKNCGVELGKSLKKTNKMLGDISIKAVVGKNMDSDIENFRILQNISLNRVMQLANIVSNGIIEVVNKKVESGKNIYI